MLTIEDLKQITRNYLRDDQVYKIVRAYEFGANAHEGQKRASGEDYINHPLAVAYILAEMHMDHQTLMAAILHDVIEDTPTAKKQLQRKFGKGVAELVDGVSKLDKMDFSTLEQAQAHNFRKMLMAMSNDLRVILVKLADRLHNMRTLDVLRPEKRRRIARETLQVYAPIAMRLGVNNIRLELEELGFRILYPMRYRILSKHIEEARGHRKEIITKIRTALKRRLRQERVPAQILGREKHLYGIYQKMVINQFSFKEVYDVYAFRLIVDDVDTCYRAIGTVHNLYKPMPGRFKDYIAIPKTNGYQSLHTVLFGPYGVPIEIQIRTRDMNDVAEFGIAAHWLYKTGSKTGDGSGAHRRAREWMRKIMDMQKESGNPEEFYENVKIDLFPNDVYVFTPKGKIMELSAGATPVDFAYGIHTDVGNSCVGARINRLSVPLNTQLKSGQTVEIITAPGAKPDPAWLNFIATAKARAGIRQYLKQLETNDATNFGKRLLNSALSIHSLTWQDIPDDAIQPILKEYKLESIEQLLVEVGLGHYLAPVIARQAIDHMGIKNEKNKEKIENKDATPISIKGTEGVLVKFPKCCYPIPGDPIHGFLSAGKGLVIHRQDCSNVADYTNQPEKWLHVDWEENIGKDFPARLMVNVRNQRGVLATLAAAVADQGANIDHVEIKDRDDRYTTIDFIVDVHDRVHLAHVMRRLHRIKSVNHISRK